jgi:hypothetical protein
VSADGHEPWQLKKGEELSESGAIVPRVTEKSVYCHLIGRQKKVDPQRRCIVYETHSVASNRLLPARGGSFYFTTSREKNERVDGSLSLSSNKRKSSQELP